MVDRLKSMAGGGALLFAVLWILSYYNFLYDTPGHWRFGLTHGHLAWNDLRHGAAPVEQLASGPRFIGYNGLQTWWLPSFARANGQLISAVLPLWMPTAAFAAVYVLLGLATFGRDLRRESTGRCVRCGRGLAPDAPACETCGVRPRPGAAMRGMRRRVRDSVLLLVVGIVAASYLNVHWTSPDESVEVALTAGAVEVSWGGDLRPADDRLGLYANGFQGFVTRWLPAWGPAPAPARGATQLAIPLLPLMAMLAVVMAATRRR